MDPTFWHRRWAKNEIAFHNSDTHPMLSAHFHHLSVPSGGRVFVPLCGKTLDIHWLLYHGYQVVGAELSQIAIEQLFSELRTDPVIKSVGDHRRYSAEGIDIFVGDIFDLSPQTLGPVDAIYDRAALVALPEVLRKRYAAHVIELGRRAPQLLITLEYDQSQVDGPPFSVAQEECLEHYRGVYEPILLSSQQIPGGIKGLVEAKESVWLLKPCADKGN